jgi:c-di-GMP phosphodiesterase
MKHPILGQVALGYSPLIDRDRNVMATRLIVFALDLGRELNAAELLAAVGEVWPADGPQVALSVRSESLLQDLMAAQPTQNVWIEVPGFMACEAVNSASIRELHERGNTLLLSGRPPRELPRELLPCFKHAIIDLADDRRVDQSATHDPGVSRTIGFVQGGVGSIADMESSFKRGALAVLGWPIDDAVTAGARSGGANPDLQVIIELINRVKNEEPIARLEATLRRDPALAYKLMRYINSPAFGMSVQIDSFGHAIMLLGYKRLLRWLALLLATASRDANMRPVMFAAVRRGMMMDALGAATTDDATRSDMFICGVFSLLDRMFGQPFAQLLQSIPVPEAVYDALANESGPYEPYLRLVRAVEQATLPDMIDAHDRLMLQVGEVNRALLAALAAASRLGEGA